MSQNGTEPIHVDTITSDKQSAWDERSQLSAELSACLRKDANNPKSFFANNFPDLSKVFLEKTTCVCCIDEGTAHADMTKAGEKSGEGEFTLAGSGILYPAENEQDRLDKVADLLIAHGVQNVTSHAGCGAAGLAYKRDNPGISPLPAVVDEYAKDWVKKLSDVMKSKGHGVNVTHIEYDEMERPKDFHNARVVYFDTVGGFSPSKQNGLPMGFVIEGGFLPADYAGQELKVAVNIAFGHHGFGSLFTTENPFVIIVFSVDEASLNKKIEEIKKVLDTDDPGLGYNRQNYADGKILIGGMVVDKK